MNRIGRIKASVPKPVFILLILFILLRFFLWNSNQYEMQRFG